MPFYWSKFIDRKPQSQEMIYGAITGQSLIMPHWKYVSKSLEPLNYLKGNLTRMFLMHCVYGPLPSLKFFVSNWTWTRAAIHNEHF